jgi:hypothetical protein
MNHLEIMPTKIGSVVSRVALEVPLQVTIPDAVSRVGDVIVVRAITESITYGNLELPSGRLAKIVTGDILVGALGKRRALKGFVGEVPERVAAGDSLHLLNMGGVIGLCQGHHSSLSDAIEVEVIGVAADATGRTLNIADNSLPITNSLGPSAPLVMIAGTCMNSGKTVAATEIIKQAANSGIRVIAAKLTGIACLRDTLHMKDNGAFETASFLDCGLPSSVDHADLPSVAKTILRHLNSFSPDLIVAELGDGIVGGYSVDDVLRDPEIREAITSFVFCASDYVGVIGGRTVLDELGITIDLVAGSVTDSPMGEEYVRTKIGLQAGNAKRDGGRLFELATKNISTSAAA